MKGRRGVLGRRGQLSSDITLDIFFREDIVTRLNVMRYVAPSSLQVIFALPHAAPLLP